MTPAARLQAASDILDLLSKTRRPAEEVLKDWGRNNRYAGSKDRRAIADKVYQCLRARERLSFAMDSSAGRALVLGALHFLDGVSLSEIDDLYTGEGYAPPKLSVAERKRLEAGDGEAPEWLESGLPAFVVERLKSVYGDDWLKEAEALMLPRAPIDLRVNGDRAPLIAGLEMLGYRPEPTPFSAFGVRLPADPPPNVRALPAFRQGTIEIQDEGSQLAGFLAGAMPGMTVVDYCAGGGGKTLALLQAMQGEGRLIASDVEKTRLNNIKPRLTRAGLEAELRQLGPDGEGMEDLEAQADLVLVDAPCSGSGVWRRRPETAHKLQEQEVARLHELQSAILHRASRLVKPGGLLAYATCSILPDENEMTADRFEADHPWFTPRPVAEALDSAAVTPEGAETLKNIAQGHRLRLSPGTSHTDGFFVSLYRRKP
ncbi:RsmB/NOP family class I SAM-dependent RNA methyltransferase [Asticcacaulis excentricus]|uniref:Fmu (Sun) domain protein n=1 Tax=Asticcacaulis excentricus (strain ATCC 15261 / DSM 4724 / KCTC 12464 / NCIMB 9791 / VKM B-1370 / CB 48) TaxID=573065 RepID=E8RS29_ASTEC|nr:RsmB/NOP family class I SAM-dependent RNA methyltransferase [Asticcacaulis excentricus]ADU14300.1 Fmu (Sun) domain protein [Asticcacaulis excentricus CB 48]